jgi:hypothetical protein
MSLPPLTVEEVAVQLESIAQHSHHRHAHLIVVTPDGRAVRITGVKLHDTGAPDYIPWVELIAKQGGD